MGWIYFLHAGTYTCMFLFNYSVRALVLNILSRDPALGGRREAGCT